MNDKEVSHRVFSSYDEFFRNSSRCQNQENAIPLDKSELVNCFGKDSALVCYRAKSKISPDVAQEAILTHIENRLRSSKSVAVIYHISEDYSLIDLSNLLERVDEIICDDKCAIFSTCINETIFGVEFIFNFS
ncbi:conserved hypothetical protein [Sulfurovum sp. enrichment culture clone C5]|uniref:Uncharacterized protein n=1 Tax=Sulfurovum sp. enrichment culture clone C5 TaxID=497650 RepID=A0A0S4XNI5_9BACT|nr:conserved hypothetical protein [Sulfurovum sp. enrichment culture clone C5]